MKPGSHAARPRRLPRPQELLALASRATVPGGSRLGSCASFSGKCEHDKSASAKAAHTASQIRDLSITSLLPRTAHTSIIDPMRYGTLGLYF